MNALAELNRSSKVACILMLCFAAHIDSYGQQSHHKGSTFTVTVQVNDSQVKTTIVPQGQIVIIDYDVRGKYLSLLDIEPRDLHPSLNYQKLGSIFFSAIRPGQYKLNWQGGACRAKIVVK